MIKRLLIHIKDKLDEKTYKELWEEQNIQLDKQKLEIRRRDKKIMKLECQLKKVGESE
jgi:hypothetical protein